jgi:hypothetical protein
MPMAYRPRPTPENRGTLSPAKVVEKAEDTVQELRTALARVGITLPSLRLDPLSVVRDEPTPLVDLGRCTTQMAERLVQALQDNQNTTTGSRTP